jgi:phage/plasmid-associated DNA primase
MAPNLNSPELVTIASKRPIADAPAPSSKRARVSAAEEIVFYNLFDPRHLKCLVKYWGFYGPELVEDPVDRKRNKKLLQRILKKANDKGVLKTVYTRPPGQARIFCDTSLQSMTRAVKHTLVRHLYHDIDMVNAAPTLLLQYCDKNDIAVAALRAYVQGRDDLLDDLVERLSIDRDAAKRLVDTTINNGKVPAYAPDWLRAIKAEGLVIATHLQQNRPDIWEAATIASKIKNSGNVPGKAVARLAFEIEAECLGEILAQLDERGHLADSRAGEGKRVADPGHDGVGVLRKGNKKKFPEAVLREIEEAVRDQCGWDIVLREKPMDGGMDIPAGQLEEDEMDELDELMAMPNSGAVAEHMFHHGQSYLEAFMYCKTARSWYMVEDGAWRDTFEALDLKKTIKAYMQHLAAEYAGRGREVSTRFMENMTTESFWTQVATALKVYQNRSDFCTNLDGDGDILACTDQVYRFSTGAWEPITPAHCVQRTTGYPRPTVDRAIRDDIMRVLRDLWDTTADMEYVLGALALALRGGNTLQEFYFLSGEGANGKTVLLNGLTAALGKYLCNMQSVAFTKPKQGQNEHSDLWRTKGARLIVTQEPAHNGSLQMDFAKDLTGGGYVTSRAPHSKAPLEFIPSATPVMACNTIVRLSQCNYADRRRLRVILFPMTYLFETDSNYEPDNPRHKMRDESIEPRFLTQAYGEQMLLILLEFYDKHLQADPKNVNTMRTEFHINNTEAYFREQDPVLVCFLENYVVTKDPAQTIRTSEVHMKIQETLASGSYKPSPQRIRKTIEKLGVTRTTKDHGCTCYVGIRPRSFLDDREDAEE